jgi:hypothetical protein
MARGRLIASQLQRIVTMKTATFPSVRVEAELREAAESVLREGETLTSLIETAMRETIHRRRVQDEFVARGLRSSDDAKRTGLYQGPRRAVGPLGGGRLHCAQDAQALGRSPYRRAAREQTRFEGNHRGRPVRRQHEARGPQRRLRQHSQGSGYR